MPSKTSPRGGRQHREALIFKNRRPKLCKRGAGCTRNDPDRELEHFDRIQMRLAS